MYANTALASDTLNCFVQINCIFVGGVTHII